MKVEYLCKTDKRLVLQRVFLNAKESASGKAASDVAGVMEGLEVSAQEDKDKSSPMEESGGQNETETKS